MRNSLKIYRKYLATPGRSALHGGVIAFVLLALVYLLAGEVTPGRWMILPAILVVAAGIAGGILNYFIFPFKFKSPHFRLIPKLIGGVIYIAMIAVALVIGMNGAG
jgi:small-conductance mechanosensitive channel